MAGDRDKTCRRADTLSIDAQTARTTSPRSKGRDNSINPLTLHTLTLRIPHKNPHKRERPRPRSPPRHPSSPESRQQISNTEELPQPLPESPRPPKQRSLPNHPGKPSNPDTRDSLNRSTHTRHAGITLRSLSACRRGSIITDAMGTIATHSCVGKHSQVNARRPKDRHVDGSNYS